MNRISIIQYLIDKYDYRRYLEIGVQKGKSFLPIKCKKKIAVDPQFQISFKDKWKWFYKNPTNWNNSYFEMTSDRFFQKHNSYLKKNGGIDICLIDGLHTFRATLNDLLSSLHHLKADGVVICHDCFPPHSAAAIPAEDAKQASEKGRSLKGWTGEWCGDSWKAIAYLKKISNSDLDVSVLNMDYGLGVVKYTSRNSFNHIIDENLFDKIKQLTYEDLRKNPQALIGLLSKDEFVDI